MTACILCATGSFADTVGSAMCRECKDVFSPAEPQGDGNLWVTMQRQLWRSQWQWMEVEGASTVESCTCATGFWLNEDGACTACTEGMICKGRGVVAIEPGYFAAHGSAGSVWLCHGSDPARCPGGAPGTCARHRLNTSIACGECEANMREASDGTCVVCTEADGSVLAVALVVLVGVLFCIHYAIVTHNRAKEKDSFALVLIIGSQLVTVLQMLGVCSLLSVVWPEPFATILSMTSLLNFRTEILNMGCVVSMTVLARYTFTAVGFLFLVLVMIVLHLLHVLIFHFTMFRARRFGRFTPALTSAVGTIFMTAFISVSSAIVAPFQCDVHPNGEQTVSGYPQVLCWHSGQHQKMVLVGAVASVIPVSFLSMCVWVISSLPRRLLQGDVAFLHAFAFLFFRFHSGSYWFVFVVLLRNTCVALVPVIPNEALELFALAMILLPSLVISARVFPWRVHLANYLDIATNGGFLLIVFLAALFKDVSDKSLIADLLIIVFFCIVSLFLGAVCVALYTWCSQRGKAYAYFLCHHKEGGGGFCRLLKMRLKSHAQVKREVFLDSDNLQDLSVLFSIVGNRVDTFVVLCSREILYRPWCVGEMCTADLHSINTILILFPEFQWPSPEFIADIGTHVEGVESLAQYGISLAMARGTLQRLSTRRQVILPPSITLECMQSVVGHLVDRKLHKRTSSSDAGVSVKFEVACSSVVPVPSTSRDVWARGLSEEPESHSNCLMVHVQQDLSRECEVVSVVDHSNNEAVCAALIVRELLIPYYPLLSKVPHVLGRDEDVPKGVRTVLVICSTGCFHQPCFVRQLFQVEALGAGAVPVVVETGFRFPSDTWFAELRAIHSDRRIADSLVQVIRKLFEEIAIKAFPQDSHDVLVLRAKSISQRLCDGVTKSIVCLDGVSFDEPLTDHASHSTVDSSDSSCSSLQRHKL